MKSELIELTDKELEAVAGGFLNGLGNITTLTSTHVQVPVSVDTGAAAAAVIAPVAAILANISV